MTDYLMDDDAYIQMIANDAGSITHSDETQFAIVEVAEKFIKGDDTSFAFEIMFKYLEKFAFSRHVMEFATFSINTDVSTKFRINRLRDIWIGYFNDGRYGDTETYGFYGANANRTLCERYSINQKLAIKLVDVFEKASHSKGTAMVLDELRRCWKGKSLMPEQKKLGVAYEALTAEYIDGVTVDV